MDNTNKTKRNRAEKKNKQQRQKSESEIKSTDNQEEVPREDVPGEKVFLLSPFDACTFLCYLCSL